MPDRFVPITERLEFRRWRDSDLSAASRLWGDPAVMRLLGGPYDAAAVSARLEREIANDVEHGVQYWPLFLRTSGDFVGCCGLKPYQPENRFLELGFHLRQPFWGGGYASEAARAVIEFAFGRLECAALFAGHHPENEPSSRLLAKLGFACIGTHFYEPTGLQHPWYRLERMQR